MWNAANKLFRLTMPVVLALGLLTACGESKEEKAAKELLAQATVDMNDGRLQQALAIVDTIPVLFPKQVKVRRSAMDLRPVIVEMITDGEIAECEADIESTEQAFARARSKMVKIVNPELVEPYWVAAGQEKVNVMNATGLQARVDDDGIFTIISEVVGAGNLHHNSITLQSADGATATSGTVPYDDELNYRINGSETVTFTGESIDTLGVFADKHRGAKLTLVFNGEKGQTRKQQLTEKQVEAIADAYNMAALKLEGLRLVAKRNYLEKKKQVAVRQQHPSTPAEN